jgi:GNAT superfamily N-acetyltransferase
VTDTLPTPAVLGRPGQAYEAARLRWATSKDVPQLVVLWRTAYPDDRADALEMAEWIERGGALALQDRDGTLLAALRWRDFGDGWQVDRVATRPEARGLGYGRWLTTKVEALAIKRSVPYLELVLPEPDGEDQLAYYRRMGYAPADPSGRTLRKVVGGEWQTVPRVGA